MPWVGGRSAPFCPDVSEIFVDAVELVINCVEPLMEFVEAFMDAAIMRVRRSKSVSAIPVEYSWGMFASRRPGVGCPEGVNLSGG
jgi:hypothetical protein